MKRAALATILLLVGCSSTGNATSAEVACEQFVERRIGVEVEFDSDHTTEQTDEGWYVRSRFDAGDGVHVYECDVAHADGEWTLGELTTDR